MLLSKHLSIEKKVQDPKTQKSSISFFHYALLWLALQHVRFDICFLKWVKNCLNWKNQCLCLKEKNLLACVDGWVSIARLEQGSSVYKMCRSPCGANQQQNLDRTPCQGNAMRV